MATTPHAGAHTESRFDRKIKSYSHRKRHYTFAKMTPRSKQNQWLISREPARSVEDGSGFLANVSRFLGCLKGRQVELSRTTIPSTGKNPGPAERDELVE